MKISVSGQKLDTGKSLAEYVEVSLEGGISKYFDNAIDADVVFSKEAHLFCTDIVVNEGTGSGITIKSQAKADDIYASFDMAADRVEKQLRRYKRRLKNHHKKAHIQLANSEAFSATKYTISDDSTEEAKEDANPLIIAEKQTQIETLTVSDAVMRMNLANLPALMFINKKTGGINLVYHRKDGNVTWVDSNVKSENSAAA